MKKFLFALFSIIVLTSCGTSYKVDVDLTTEKIQEVKTEIEELKTAVAEFNPDQSDYNFPKDLLIELARAYEELGEIGKAIKVYQDTLDGGINNRVIIHNLGRLYEKSGQYDLAVEQYQRLVDEYFLSEYLKDITWAYIRAKERKTAEKYFNAWQLEFSKTDESIQDAIKRLREEEKKS